MIGLSIVTNSNYYYSMKEGQASEYLTEKGQAPSRWSGGLAEKMGLRGEVTKEDFDAFGGRDPEKEANQRKGRVSAKMEKIQEENPSLDEKEARALAGKQTPKERLGLNVTYSAPKSVSLAYGQGTAEQRADMVSAHTAGVNTANQWIEQQLANTRQGHAGAETVAASKIAIASFNHSHSRWLDDQLHTHSVLMNKVERCTDGSLTALEARSIYHEQKNLGHLYQNEMARALQEKGYRVEMSDQHGNFRILGVNEKWEQVFSQGQKAIDAAMPEIREKYPRASEAELREIADKKCRPSKQALTHEGQAKHDQAAWKQAGANPQEMQAAIKYQMGFHHDAGKAQNYLMAAANILHENESVFTKTALYGTTSKLSMSHAYKGEFVTTVKDLDKAFRKLKAEGVFVELAGGVTTKKMIDLEKGIMDHVRAQQGTAKPIENIKHVQFTIAAYEKETGHKMTDGQKNAVRSILTTRDQIIVIQGDAGAGKTTSFGLAGQEMRERGQVVIGLAPTGKAASELSKCLGSGQTVDSFLQGVERGAYITTDNKDKADREYHKLAAKFEERKWEKMPMFNEKDQSAYRNFLVGGGGKKIWERCYLSENGTQTIIGPGRNILGKKLSNKIEVYSRTTDGTITHTTHRDLLGGGPIGTVSSTVVHTNPERTIQPGKTTFVIDEASMMGSQKMQQVLAAADKFNARVILCGDTKQHKAISAGNIFTELQKENRMSVTKMNESIRQKNTEYRAAVAALSAKQFEKAKAYICANIVEAKTKAEMTAAVQAEYARGDYRRTHICVSTNAEKNDLNQVLRADLQQSGKVSTEEHSFNTLQSKNLSAEAKRYAFNYEVGDRVVMTRGMSRTIGNADKKNNEYTVAYRDIRANLITLTDRHGVSYKADTRVIGSEFSVYAAAERKFAAGDKVISTKNDRGLELKNGQVWEIKSVTTDGKLTLLNDKGTEKYLNLNSQYNYLDYAYATTSHKAQGMTVDKVISVTGTATNYNKEYVNITRGREEVKIITSSRQDYMKNIETEHQKSSTLSGCVGPERPEREHATKEQDRAEAREKNEGRDDQEEQQVASRDKDRTQERNSERSGPSWERDEARDQGRDDAGPGAGAEM